MNENYKYNQREHAQSIYVVLNEETKRVKIGIAYCVKTRFSSLVSASGCRLKLMYYTERIIGACDIEKQAHERFNEDRYIGVWFNIKWEDAVNCIKSLLVDYTNRNSKSMDAVIESEYETIEQPQIISKKKKETWYGSNERVLDISLGKFKRVDKDIYQNKQGKLFKIVYRDKQWLITNL